MISQHFHNKERKQINGSLVLKLFPKLLHKFQHIFLKSRINSFEKKKHYSPIDNIQTHPTTKKFKKKKIINHRNDRNSPSTYPQTFSHLPFQRTYFQPYRTSNRAPWHDERNTVTAHIATQSPESSDISAEKPIYFPWEMIVQSTVGGVMIDDRPRELKASKGRRELWRRRLVSHWRFQRDDDGNAMEHPHGNWNVM